MERTYESIMEHAKDFLNDRFGMFIHWGIYSVAAKGEWYRAQEKIPLEEYNRNFEQFNPVDYDPRKWAKLAKEAGMKYAVLTTKHHDGFCMWDSQYTDYKVTNTPAGRDLVREYVDAFRAEGIKVGFYYSLLDWHHPDFPVYNDQNHPMRGREDMKEAEKEKCWDRYTEYMQNQVRELLTQYGKIDVLWFDYSYGEMTQEKWKATELMTMVKELQPQVMVDNRLGGNLQQENPSIDAGDYLSPEQMIPAGGVTNDMGKPMPWEACITLNRHWAYCADDHSYMNAKVAIRGLVECVSKGGNLLLNVGPDAKGNLTPETEQILKEIGVWMKKNSDSIYGCGVSELPKPEWGRYTKKGNKLYAHIFDRGMGPIALFGLKDKIRYARMLADGSEAPITVPWNAVHSHVSEIPVFYKPEENMLADDIDTVLELELIEE